MPSRGRPHRAASRKEESPQSLQLPQAFAFRDLFEQLRSSWSPPPPQLQGPPYRDLVPLQGPLQPPPLQAPRYRDVVPLQGPLHPPPLQAPRYRDVVPLQGPLHPPPLQAPRYRDLVPLQGPLQPPPLQAASYRDVVPLQGPPPQFAPPGHAHYARAMQFAARPQHMRFHLYAPGRPRLFLDVLWHFQATPPGHPQGPTRLLPLPGHPQGALQRAYPPLPRFGHAGSLCWDCQVRPAATPFPCGHFILCRDCVARRLRCPCCTFFPQPGVPF
ncbi:hypothetical protein ZWY2020_015910 [Hordeum vulgare]|nr:hypothetical protein ZWY2020_015910 [Hordeum vulgare]